jgi:hypothetical protein
VLRWTASVTLLAMSKSRRRRRADRARKVIIGCFLHADT